ncbi:MAG: FecR family protein, partial [Bacteroidota bacterium]
MIREREILLYLTNEASPQLRASVESWAQEDLDNQAVLDFYKKIWNDEFYSKNAIDFDTESAWDNFESTFPKEIKETTPQVEQKIIELDSSNQKSNRKIIPLWLKRAAGVAAIAFFVSGLFLFRETESFALADTAGEITLADGSIVRLAENSAVKYPKSFDEASERVIQLIGSAEFDIEGNKEKPFIVQNYNTRVKVLGTIFSIKNTSEGTEVENIEGLIKFYVKDRESEAITLKQGEKATYNGRK